MTLALTPTDDAGDLNQFEKSLKDAASANAKAQSNTSEAESNADAPKEDNTPAKLRGKSREEIIEIYRELESKSGRMANDLGVQRQLTDRLIGLKREEDLAKSTAPTPAATPIRSDELLENPDKAISSVVEARLREELRQRDERLARLEQQITHGTLAAKHPDYQDYPNDPAFIEWVQKSPVRSRVAALAVQGDAGAYDGLLTEYKASKAAAEASTKTASTSRKTDAASLGLEGNGTESVSSAKIWRRADIIRLKIEKPDVYSDPQVQDEIIRAYRENRVR